MKWIFAVILSILSVQLNLFIDKAIFPYSSLIADLPVHLRGIWLSFHFMIGVTLCALMTCLPFAIFYRQYIAAIPAVLALFLFSNFFVHTVQYALKGDYTNVFFLTLLAKLIFTPLAYLYSYKVSINLVKLLTSLLNNVTAKIRPPLDAHKDARRL